MNTAKSQQRPRGERAELPLVVVLGTGGTIAGTATGDPTEPGYTAGVLDVDTLLGGVPALAGLARIETEQVANIDSKDMDAATWCRLAERVRANLVRPEVSACVITHGTDTLEETAYLLHLLHDGAKPVVLTAAMRPATALDADGPQNLLDAMRAAVDPATRELGVVCVLHGLVHAARDVTKAYVRKVDAFSSGEPGPLGWVGSTGVRRNRVPSAEVGAPFVLPPDGNWPRVEIVMSHALADGALVRALMSQADRPAGLVVAGTGNGTVNRALQAELDAAQANGTVVRYASRNGALSGGEAHGLNAVKLRVRLQLELARGDA